MQGEIILETAPLLSDEPLRVEEADLLRRAGAGEQPAFSRLVALHQQRIFSRISRQIRDRSHAEDVTQEVFLRLFRAIQAGSYRAQARLSTWLYTITSNCIADYFRSRRSHPPQPSMDRNTDRSDPSERAAANESHAQLRLHVAALPPEQRLVVEMRVMDDLSFAEIAELTGVPIPTAKSRMSYALRKIEAAMRDTSESRRIR